MEEVRMHKIVDLFAGAGYDALVTIDDKHVSVMLMLAGIEKLPAPEINSIYEFIKSTFSPFYELKIEISDSNFNAYTINGDNE